LISRGLVNAVELLFLYLGGKVLALLVNTTYHWYFQGGDSSVQKNPVQLLGNPSLNKVTLKLLSDNGCASVITKDIDVLPQPKAGFEAKDICQDSAVNFINTSQGAHNYLWRLGDGKASTAVSFKHKYPLTGKQLLTMLL